jgi:hypothetical protein
MPDVSVTRHTSATRQCACSHLARITRGIARLGVAASALVLASEAHMSRTHGGDALLGHERGGQRRAAACHMDVDWSVNRR